MDISLELASAPATAHIPVLLMSVNVVQANRFQPATNRYFVAKPFDTPDLLNVVENCTDNK